MVVGSRILGQMEKGAISSFNMIGNSLFNRTINFALRSKVTDSLTGYRALKRETFKSLVLFSRNFEIEVEMTVEALSKGYRVIEIPIKYGNRKDSKTKLNPVKDGLKIAKTLLFITMNVNPLKFFLLFTLGFIIIGIIPAHQAIYEKITFGEITSIPSVVLAALLFVSAAMSLAIGLLSELLVRSRHRIEYLLTKNLK
ncbi:MAG: TIGR04182 family glycosyltransferase, partial [Thaumarchaeota archaeon]|nr:TIGR04182 family glycosyltransferase [Nitrososphaerota archaeon]